MENLISFTAPGELGQKTNGTDVLCASCGHRCRIPENARGKCKVRFNRKGELRVPFGYVSSAQCDPVEKKPFYHALPGSRAFSYGMSGCNFHCDYCQNWRISQVLQDASPDESLTRTSSEELVELARHYGAEIMVATYNEPLIANEWNVAVFKAAKAAGLLTGYVSNGHATLEALGYLQPWIDIFKVDLKTFDENRYRQLGGTLTPVLETIRALYKMGIWVEVVTLLVPGFNDSPQEMGKIAEFLAGISADIPWHVTAFHKDYRMSNTENAAPDDLVRAARIGKSRGLNFVYAGNLSVPEWENTACPGCGAILIERRGFRVLRSRLRNDGLCPNCALKIPGIWKQPPFTV